MKFIITIPDDIVKEVTDESEEVTGGNIDITDVIRHRLADLCATVVGYHCDSEALYNRF